MLKRFWNWWLQQLSLLIPERLRRLLIQKNRFFITFQNEDTITIRHQPVDQQLIDIATISVRELRLWLDEANIPDNPIFILLLSPGQYLRRRFTLPSAAQENLKQVVGFELDRHTPFAAGQVYFAVRFLDSFAKKKQILVEVVLTPKNLLDTYVSTLQQAGIPLHQVTVTDSPGLSPEMEYDLLPPELKSRPNRWYKALNIGLAGLLLILLTLAFALPVVRYNQTIQALEDEANQARKAALRANKIKQALQQLRRQARFVLDKKKAAPPMIIVLEELSQRLPSDTWLTGFQYRDGKVNIDGKSPAASKLVELLEKSPYLKNVHFVSPITQDRSSGLERFRISMEIVHDTKPTHDS